MKTLKEKKCWVLMTAIKVNADQRTLRLNALIHPVDLRPYLVTSRQGS